MNSYSTSRRSLLLIYRPREDERLATWSGNGDGTDGGTALNDEEADDADNGGCIDSTLQYTHVL